MLQAQALAPFVHRLAEDSLRTEIPLGSDFAEIAE